MIREELIRHFYELTEREEYLRENPGSAQNAFYRFLEEEGYRESDGVYHMPSIYFAYQDSSAPRTFADSIDHSPYQSIFRIKKRPVFSASRFLMPISFAFAMSIPEML